MARLVLSLLFGVRFFVLVCDRCVVVTLSVLVFFFTSPTHSTVTPSHNRHTHAPQQAQDGDHLSALAVSREGASKLSKLSQKYASMRPASALSAAK